MDAKNHIVHALPNGIRVVHRRIDTAEMAHCGIMLDIGSRDETASNQGIVHFWEHMAFKGTRNRNAYHILNSIESLGGEINAFTDKEKIFFYVTIRDVYLEKAIELLADITFNAVFPSRQIELERSVVLEEMAMCSDDLDELLHDKFENTLFGGHPLGMNTLGTKKTIQSFRKEDFEKFLKTRLDTRKVVFSSVSRAASDTVIRAADKYMGNLPFCASTWKRKKFKNYIPKATTIKRDIQQLRYAMGCPAYPLKDSRKSAFSMLVNVLGGSGMNSRLNWALREKRGYVYSIGACYIPFTDTGFFMISFGMEARRIENSLKVIIGELHRLREKPLGSRQMKAAREQALTRIVVMKENNLSLMTAMARNLLDLGEVVTTQKMQAEVQNTTPVELMELANEIFDETRFCTLSIEPR